MAKERDKLTPAVGGNSAGHVAADSRGRNVWQWNDSQLDSTTIMLQRLENTRAAASFAALAVSRGADKRKARSRISHLSLIIYHFLFWRAGWANLGNHNPMPAFSM